MFFYRKAVEEISLGFAAFRRTPQDTISFHLRCTLEGCGSSAAAITFLRSCVHWIQGIDPANVLDGQKASPPALRWSARWY